MQFTQPEGTHVAHFNWATLVGDLGSPEVAGFENAVDRVNALAERSPGFVWRLGSEMEAAHAAGWPMFTENPRVIASFSVWKAPAGFTEYVYKTVHGAFFRRRAEWFVPGSGGHVLWWVPAGHIPDVTEARARLERLQAEGPSEEAFTTAEVRGNA